MSKNSSNQGPDKVTNKYPGLSDKKPVKSISVQRPLDTDRKTVTETNLEPIPDDVEAPAAKKKRQKNPARSKTKQSSKEPRAAVKAAKTASDDDIVLELPPSPQHRKAKRRKALWIWAAVIVTILTAGWAILYFSPILAIEDISHEGLDLVAESEAEERTAGLAGTPLPQVTDRKVTELFAENPAVDHVTLRAEPAPRLIVIVHERKPIAMSPSGKQYVVFSDDGTELAQIPAKRAQEFDLPVVASASDVTDQEVFDTITTVLGSLPEDLRDQVRAASGSSIDSIELELSSGKMVMWGNSEQPEKKAQVLKALLGLDETAAEQISEYDVSAPDFPVTR